MHLASQGKGAARSAATMLALHATNLLVAAIAQSPAIVNAQVGACPDGYENAMEAFMVGANIRLCCTPNTRHITDWSGQPEPECYTGPEVCKVSSASFRCCFPPIRGTTVGGTDLDSVSIRKVQCYATTEEECADSVLDSQWCPSPAEPAPPADEGISEAIVTVIVFVSLVAVAGAAGAYAVCRGAARS